jgi:hypothetical protein
MAFQMDAILLGGGRRQDYHVIHQLSQVCLDKPQFDRPGKVHQCLHYAVQALNFAADHVDMPPRIGIDLL